MNKNHARYWIDDAISMLAYNDCFEYPRGKHDRHAYAIHEKETKTAVYIFEPTFPGEKWEILFRSLGLEEPSSTLRMSVSLLSERINADVLFAEEIETA